MIVEEKFINDYCKQLGLRWWLIYVGLASGKRAFHIEVVDQYGTVQFFFESCLSEHMTEYVLRRQVSRKAVTALKHAVEKRAAAQALLTPVPTPNPLPSPVLPPAATLPRLPLSAKQWLQQQEQQGLAAGDFVAPDISQWHRKPLPQEAK